MLVGAGSEAEPVVVALVEDAQGGHRCAILGRFGQRSSHQAPGQALMAGDVAGDGEGDRRQVEGGRRRTDAVVQRSSDPMHQTLRRSAKVGHHGAAARQHVGEHG